MPTTTKDPRKVDDDSLYRAGHRALDAERSASDVDQGLADSDHTASDADQSDAEQDDADADADQRASN